MLKENVVVERWRRIARAGRLRSGNIGPFASRLVLATGLFVSSEHVWKVLDVFLNDFFLLILHLQHRLDMLGAQLVFACVQKLHRLVVVGESLVDL